MQRLEALVSAFVLERVQVVPRGFRVLALYRSLLLVR